MGHAGAVKRYQDIVKGCALLVNSVHSNFINIVSDKIKTVPKSSDNLTRKIKRFFNREKPGAGPGSSGRINELLSVNNCSLFPSCVTFWSPKPFMAMSRVTCRGSLGSELDPLVIDHLKKL